MSPVAMADSGATAANTRLTVADGDSGTEVTASEIVTDPVTNDTSTVITTMTINADLLANDEDADGDDTLTITAVKGYTDVDPNDKTRQRQDVATGAGTFGKNGGVFTLNANGAWSFDPNGDFNDLTADETRTTSVEYTVADASGATSTATLTVTVSPNSAPTAFVDPGTTDEDTLLTVADGATGTARAGGVGRNNADLLLNDRDADGNPLTITRVGPDATPENQKAANIGKAIDGNNGGSFTIEANGAWSFDPDGDFDDLSVGASRTTWVFYTASDGSLSSHTGVVVTVTGANDPLTARDDTGNAIAGRVLTVAADDDGLILRDSATGTATGIVNAGLLFNDEDPDTADTLSISTVGSASNNRAAANVGIAIDGMDENGNRSGRFTIQTNGAWSFDPDGDFDDLGGSATRTTQVTYTVTDGRGATDTATLTVTVRAANAVPDATADIGTVHRDDTLNVGAADRGIRVSGETQRANAGLLVNDADADTTATFTEILTITAVGDSTLTVTGAGVGNPIDGSNGGSFTINADGSWTFDPEDDFDDLATDATRTTSVAYRVTDSYGASDTVTLTVTVAANYQPTANDDIGRIDLGRLDDRADRGVTYDANGVLMVADNAIGITEQRGSVETIYNRDLLNNDMDDARDGDRLTISAVNGAAAGVGAAVDGTKGGEFTIAANGAWSFNHDGDFDALKNNDIVFTSVTYTVADGEGGTDTATLEVRVIGTNDGPQAGDDFGRANSGVIRTVANGATGVVFTNTDNSTMTINADLLLNDIDPEGDAISISAVAGLGANIGKATDGSNGGSFTIQANGAWSFDPDGDFDNLAEGATRTTTVQYTVSERGITDTATLTVTVVKRNLAPTANADVGAIAEGTTLTVIDGDTGATVNGVINNRDLLLNDSDPEGDPLSIATVSGAAGNLGKAVAGSNGGSFTIRADGSWSFEQGDDFKGMSAGDSRTTSVVYTTTDGALTSTATTLTVTVNGVNEAPVAQDDQGTTLRNRVLTVANDATGLRGGLNADLLRNDADPDNSDILTVSTVKGYTAARDGTRQDVRAGAGTYGSAGGRFTLSANGAWSFDPDGDFDDLAAGATRTTSVDYTAADANGGTDTATLTVTVVGRTTNAAPDATDDSGRTHKGAVLTVAADADGARVIDGDSTATTSINVGLLQNDRDTDGDRISITAVGRTLNTITRAGLDSPVDGSNGGSFTIGDDGAWEFDPDGDFDNLKVGETSPTSVAYRLTDVHGGVSTATLTVIVTGRQAPVAGDDFGSTSENTNLPVADGDKGSTGPGGGAQNADLLLNDTGDSLRITRVIGYTDAVGEDGGHTTPRNLPVPVGSEIDTYGKNGGVFTIRADGSWDFDPGNDFHDLKDGETRTTSVVYEASDRSLNDVSRLAGAATLTVTVTGANDAPDAVDDTGTTSDANVREVAAGDTGTGPGGAQNAGLLLNDTDVEGDTLTISAVNGAADSVGKAVDVAGGGKFTINADGSWEFDPDGDFAKLEDGDTRDTSVRYTVSDANGGTDTATLTVTVTPNRAPVAVADAGVIDEDTVLTVKDGATATTTSITETVTDPGTGDTSTATRTITGNADLLLNDNDADVDPLTITAVKGYTDAADDGTRQRQDVAVGAETRGSKGGVFTIEADGSYTFDPDGDFDEMVVGQTRTTSVQYTVSDGARTNTATLTVTVTGENTDPAPVDDRGAFVLYPTTLIVANDATGTVITRADGSTMTVNADLLLNDGDIDSDSDSFTITGVNGDVDNVAVAAAGSNGGSFTIYANGGWSFFPNADFNNLRVGETRDTSVRYTVSDAEGGAATATLTLTVSANAPPVVGNDFGATDQDTTLTVADGATGTIVTNADNSTMTVNADLLLNDRDDVAGVLRVLDPVNILANTIEADGSAGGSFTINADGAWSFDPDGKFDDLGAGETRDTWVDYTVTDNRYRETARLTVTVTGLNAAPVVMDNTGATTENAKITVADGDTGTNADLLNDATDDDNDTLTISAVTGYSRDTDGAYQARAEQPVVDGTPTSTLGSSGGTFTLSTNGAWSFDPGKDFDNLDAGETRDTQVQYTVSDGNKGGTATATLTVTVTGENDVPTAGDDLGAFTVTVDDKVLTVVDGATGTTITVSDGKGGTMSVTGNRDLLLNDEDAEGAPTITEVDGGAARVGVATAVTDDKGRAAGSFTIRADGSWTFDPGDDFDELAAGVTRDTSVQYTIFDGGLTDTATLTVTVTGINDAPVAVDDTGRATPNQVRAVADGAEGIGADGFNADLLLNDRDPEGDTLSISAVNGDTGSVGKAIDAADGGVASPSAPMAPGNSTRTATLTT